MSHPIAIANIGSEHRAMNCLRCGKEFENPVPEVTNISQTANSEIATSDWCADCNRLAMNVVFRESTFYKVKARVLGHTQIAVNLSAPAFVARSPSGKERQELEEWIEMVKRNMIEHPESYL